MDDIVDRLRGKSATWNKAHGRDPEKEEAANEIEMLRAAIRFAVKAEREACVDYLIEQAKFFGEDEPERGILLCCASSIRARSEGEPNG